MRPTHLGKAGRTIKPEGARSFGRAGKVKSLVHFSTAHGAHDSVVRVGAELEDGAGQALDRVLAHPSANVACGGRKALASGTHRFGAKQAEESPMQRRDLNAPDAYHPVAAYTQAIEVSGATRTLYQRPSRPEDGRHNP
jgi:hypothetical protein